MSVFPRRPHTPRPERHLLRELADQFRQLYPLLLLLYIPILAVLGAMFAYWYHTGKDISKLTQDPIAVVERELLEFQRAPDKSIHTLALLQLPFYTGIISNLGALCWCAAATLLYFAAAASRRLPQPPYPPPFLFSAAALTTVLLLDDFFLLHERALPRYLGVPDHLALLAYALIFGVHLLRFRGAIRNSDYLLFSLALACFTISLAIDLFPETPTTQFLEDGAKFAGIVSWLGYHGRIAWQQMLGLG